MARWIALPTLLLITSAAFVLSQSQSENNHQGPREIRISVNQQSNPLLDAARQVAEELEIAVSFEGPDWSANTDLMRLADTPLALSRPPEVRARIDPNITVPGAGTIQVRTQLRGGEDRFQLAGQLLQDCLEDHARRDNAGRFKLVQLENYGYSIIPKEVREKSGAFVSASSPLDARISFPRAKRHLGPTLELISQAISKSSGKKLELDIYSLPGLFTIYDVAWSNSGANNEVAREVLARTLREITVDYDRSLMMAWDLERRLDRDRNKSAYVLRFTNFIHANADGTTETIYWPDPSKK